MWRERLQQQFVEAVDDGHARLEEKSNRLCQEVIDSLINALEDRVAAGGFDSSESREAINETISEVVEAYELAAHGPAQAAVLAKSLARRLPILFAQMAMREKLSHSQELAEAWEQSATLRQTVEQVFYCSVAHVYTTYCQQLLCPQHEESIQDMGAQLVEAAKVKEQAEELQKRKDALEDKLRSENDRRMHLEALIEKMVRPCAHTAGPGQLW